MLIWYNTVSRYSWKEQILCLFARLISFIWSISWVTKINTAAVLFLSYSSILLAMITYSHYNKSYSFTLVLCGEVKWDVIILCLLASLSPNVFTFYFKIFMWHVMNKACFHYSAQSFINQHQTCPSGVSNHGAAVNWVAPSKLLRLSKSVIVNSLMFECNIASYQTFVLCSYLLVRRWSSCVATDSLRRCLAN